MKTWRIHFAWTIVTGLVAAVSARIAAPPEAGAPPWSPDPTVAPAPLGSKPPGLGEPTAEDSGLDPVPTAVSQNVPPEKAESPLRERVRGLMKAPNGWEDLQKLMLDVTQRAAFLAVLKDLLNDPEIQVQFYSLSLLRTMKAPESASWVAAYLSLHLEKDDGSASNAIGALGEIGDPACIPILREALRSKVEDTRLAAAQALQQVGDSGPANDLITAMARQFDSPDGSLRKKAIELIARFQSEAGLPIFVRGLRDSNGDVRLQAVWALSNLGNRDYLPLLQPLVSDPNPEVAKEAADAVENLKSQQQ